jgi:hypothetical protein
MAPRAGMVLCGAGGHPRGSPQAGAGGGDGGPAFHVGAVNGPDVSDLTDAWHAQTEWESDASYAAGFAAGYARAVADVAAEIEAATGRAAGTPERTIRWLVRTWDWPRTP